MAAPVDKKLQQVLRGVQSGRFAKARAEQIQGSPIKWAIRADSDENLLTLPRKYGTRLKLRTIHPVDHPIDTYTYFDHRGILRRGLSFRRTGIYATGKSTASFLLRRPVLLGANSHTLSTSSCKKARVIKATFRGEVYHLVGFNEWGWFITPANGQQRGTCVIGPIKPIRRGSGGLKIKTSLSDLSISDIFEYNVDKYN